jgi:DNA-binding NarL/FixJ family response regulator
MVKKKLISSNSMRHDSLPKREIILADNQALTACGIKYLLENDRSTKITEAKEKQILLDAVTDDVALIIIDYLSVKNFDASGIAKLKGQNPRVPILVITSDHNKQTIVEVLETGVNGFLFKDCYQDEIIRAVDAIMAGQKFYCNKVFDILMETRQQKTVGDCLPTKLTIREIDIIKLVVKGQSTITIAQNLNLSPHTISTHRKNIIKKLKIKSPVELVTYAYDLGLIEGK